MPLILLYFTDEHFLFSWVWALNFTQFNMLSTMPQLEALKKINKSKVSSVENKLEIHKFT